MSYALKFQNAVALGLKWGVHRTSSGAEVLAFRKELRAVGVTPRDECALLAWLTGSRPESELSWWEDVKLTSIEEHCEAEGFADVDLAGAVARLSEASPMLANLLYVKATAKVEAEQAWAVQNAKQALAKDKDNLVKVLENANDAVKLAVTNPKQFIVKALREAASLRREITGGILDFIPGGGWTVAAVTITALAIGAGYLIRSVR